MEFPQDINVCFCHVHYNVSNHVLLLCVVSSFRRHHRSFRRNPTIVQMRSLSFFPNRPHQLGTLLRPGMQSAIPQIRATHQASLRSPHQSQRTRRCTIWQVSTTGLSGGVTSRRWQCRKSETRTKHERNDNEESIRERSSGESGDGAIKASSDL